jgi:transcription elongation GreA/GreB family factor
LKIRIVAVSIGTVVTRNAETKMEETYTILGAWDGDPDRHISYLKPPSAKRCSVMKWAKPFL